MSQIQTTRPGTPATTAKAWRIRYVAEAPSGSTVIRRFVDPGPAVAVMEAVDLADVPRDPQASEAADPLYVVVVPLGTAARLLGPGWLSPPEQIDAPRAVSFPFEKGKISWRPGRVLVERNSPLSEPALAAIAEFAFYEAELRQLESAISPHEVQGVADAAYSHRVRHGHQEHWDRFDKAIETLALMRLRFARLEPRLYLPDRSLPVELRHLIARLSRRATIEDRLEALSDRLEACEELYEGAVDRISDYRWYRKGHVLEIAIVVLLAIEVIQLSADMVIRLMMHAGK